jgi:hypothetical protein
VKQWQKDNVAKCEEYKRIRATYHAKWAIDNAEHLSEYRAGRAEKIRAQRRVWYLKHKEEHLARMRLYRAKKRAMAHTL